MEVKRRSACVCFSGSVCVCQHRRLSRGDGHPPADSQRANYGIIRREREGGHMCRVSATPTTRKHTHTHTPVKAQCWRFRSKKRGSQRSRSPIAWLRAGAVWAERQFPADDPRSQSLRPGSPSIRGGVAGVIEPPVCASITAHVGPVRSRCGRAGVIRP